MDKEELLKFVKDPKYILLLYFPEQKTQIIPLISLLDDIKNRVEIRFPYARDFVRPGFDEIESG